MSGQTTARVEDYLGQIKRLEEDGQRCTATLLAQTLMVSLPSASEMLKRLMKEGFVDRSSDGGLILTAAGRRPAHEVLRRHRLIERLLTDRLQLPWYETHAEAHRLEHSVSRRVEEKLFEVLGFPEYCPHGHPICPFDRRSTQPLAEAQPGDEFGVAQVSEVREELLSYFDQVGLRPGTVIKLVDAAEFGPMTLLTERGTVSLSREVAVLVQVCPPDEADWIYRSSIHP